MTKTDIAIERLKSFEPPEGYYLAFSGGKDSCVIKSLADMAGVKYDAHYNVTCVDPPELVKFIKDNHKDVLFDFPKDSSGEVVTMWSLILAKKYPPTRLARYCCKTLKEGGGVGRFVVTGVRWAESANRKNKRHLAEEQNKAGRLVIHTENTEEASMFRFCHQQHKRVLNPIIDWTNEDVWGFINENNVPYCKLYNEGYERLGCVGCPMASDNQRKVELNKYPALKAQYLRTFEKMLNIRKERGLATSWNTADEVMTWWVNSQKKRGG